jgi:hypothetical protein
VIGKAKIVGEKIFTAPSQGGRNKKRKRRMGNIFRYLKFTIQKVTNFGHFANLGREQFFFIIIQVYCPYGPRTMV